ncbi:MAG TPA: HD domain-containing protein, partial [Flavisolibacter sp.]|nr:HD domain-containing protein [Flavisolibacter sp.]
MTESQERILSLARNNVTELFAHSVKSEFVFHNIEHTEDVAEACSLMADYYHLNDEDRFVLMLSAWFHDTGYSSGHPEGHEEVSVQIASRFLHDNSVDESIIQKVTSS